MKKSIAPILSLLVFGLTANGASASADADGAGDHPQVECISGAHIDTF